MPVYLDKGECVMYSEVMEWTRDQEERKIVASHLVKNYILKEKKGLFVRSSLYGLSGTSLNEKIVHLLKIVGLEEAADIPVERYSKGMKQRLQIARGLLNNPQYLFLDEMTLGLDIIIAKEIRNLISDLARKEGRGVLLTTHYISEAEELCDYIYILDKGEIIAEGTKEQLKGLFACEPKIVTSVQEPSLEEALMEIINQARGGAHEEDSTGNEG